MNLSTSKPLAAALGQRLRELREKLGLRQDEVAAWARRAGLRWSRTTVTAIETGHRDVALEEFLLLPYILNLGRLITGPESQKTFTELADLLPNEGSIQLTPEFNIEAQAARRLLRAGAHELFEPAISAKQAPQSREGRQPASYPVGPVQPTILVAREGANQREKFRPEPRLSLPTFDELTREEMRELVPLRIRTGVSQREKRLLERELPWFRAIRLHATRQQIWRAKWGARSEAEQKAARKFGVPAFVVAFAALCHFS
jgi:transcriptional regulator with XRE-family HTH domain